MGWKKLVVVGILSLIVYGCSIFNLPIRNPIAVQFEVCTGYAPKQLNRIYHYDSIGEYRDYNELSIYQISDISFIKHVEAKWSQLSLPEEILNCFQMRTDFDPMMERMIEDMDGYWHANINECGKSWVCVYHVDNGQLYIRRWN